LKKWENKNNELKDMKKITEVYQKDLKKGEELKVDLVDKKKHESEKKKETKNEKNEDKKP
jgi:hypothetical protein